MRACVHWRIAAWTRWNTRCAAGQCPFTPSSLSSVQPKWRCPVSGTGGSARVRRQSPGGPQVGMRGGATTTSGKRALLGGSLNDFHLPAFLLSDVGPKPDSPAGLADEPGCFPVLAFINPKSGDGISKRLGMVLRIQLGSGQVEPMHHTTPQPCTGSRVSCLGRRLCAPQIAPENPISWWCGIPSRWARANATARRLVRPDESALPNPNPASLLLHPGVRPDTAQPGGGATRAARAPSSAVLYRQSGGGGGGQVAGDISGRRRRQPVVGAQSGTMPPTLRVASVPRRLGGVRLTPPGLGSLGLPSTPGCSTFSGALCAASPTLTRQLASPRRLGRRGRGARVAGRRRCYPCRWARATTWHGPWGGVVA